jgi:hypothetical protein
MERTPLPLPIVNVTCRSRTLGFSKTFHFRVLKTGPKVVFYPGLQKPISPMGSTLIGTPPKRPPQKMDFSPIFLAPLECSDENFSSDQIGSGLGALANAVDRVWISAPVLEI